MSFAQRFGNKAALMEQQRQADAAAARALVMQSSRLPSRDYTSSAYQASQASQGASVARDEGGSSSTTTYILVGGLALGLGAYFLLYR